MAYVNITRPSGGLNGRGLGAIPRPVQRLRVKNMLPRGRGMGYAISAAAPYFTPDPPTFVTVTPTTGALPFQVVSTESYLQQNLVGQMQNSAQYNGWTLAQWIAAITADAQQRCSFYPGSCGSSTPEQLGQKYGTLAYQIMQLKASQQPASSPAPVPVTPSGSFGPNPTPGAIPPQVSSGPAIGVSVPTSPASPAGSPGQASIPLVPFTTPAQTSAPTGVDFSFLTNPISLFGYGVPLWMLLAAGGAGIYALASSGGGGRHR